jgi:hypothetical protein
MRGENKMITADFIKSAIDSMLKRFTKDDQIQAFDFDVIEDDAEDESYEIKFDIAKEMKSMLDGLNIQNEVERMWVDDDPSRTVYALCIAFIFDGKLYTRNEVVYN